MPEDTAPELAEKAALLASRGEEQQAIARRLGVSPATVSRLIEKAVSKGYLRRSFPELLLTNERKRLVTRELEGRDDLFSRLGVLSDGTLKGLSVEPDEASVHSAGARFLLEEVLSFARVIGVTWGRNIENFVDWVENINLKRPAVNRQNIDFVQVCGDPPGAIANPAQRSSTLVAKLNRTINGSDSAPYTFSMSASIPAKFDQATVPTIRDFIQEVGGYSKIFETTQRLKIHVDVLLTSCGSGQIGLDRWLSECAAVAGVPEVELAALTSGNIGGYWLERTGLTRLELKKLARVNASWNGIVKEDIADIASRGSVILLAAEGGKADIILELVRRHLVTHLFLSAILADQLSTILATRKMD